MEGWVKKVHCGYEWLDLFKGITPDAQGFARPVQKARFSDPVGLRDTDSENRCLLDTTMKAPITIMFPSLTINANRHDPISFFDPSPRT